MSGALKESNPWAPDLDVTVPLEDGTIIDVKPQAFVDSNEPTITVTQQPANGTVSPGGDAPGLLVANLSQEGPDEARYTLGPDTRGFVSAPAILRLTGVSQEPAPDPAESDLFLNPFRAHSAHHIPIGTGMRYLAKSHPTYATSLSKGSRLFLNAGNPFGHSIWASSGSDPLVTVHWNGSHTGLNLNAQVRIPTNVKPERVPKPGGGWRDSAATIYRTDTDQAYQFYNFAWVPENNRYEAAILRPIYSYASYGHGTVDGQRIGTSATGVAGAFGILRGWETNTPGQAIEHCLQCALPADPGTSNMLAKNSIIPRILPATSEDAAATNNAGTATGDIPYGALLAIPPQSKGGPNLDNLGLSEAGQRLAEAMVRYGIRVVDKGGDVNGALRLDQAFNNNLRDALNADMITLYPHIQCCNFDDSRWAIGGMTAFGGGEPLGPNTAFDADGGS